MHWCADVDRLYIEPHLWALRRHDFYLRTTASALLGHDMRVSLSPPVAANLAARMTETDHRLLTEHFRCQTTPAGPPLQLRGGATRKRYRIHAGKD